MAERKRVYHMKIAHPSICYFQDCNETVEDTLTHVRNNHTSMNVWTRKTEGPPIWNVF
jgi:hypothetical protein